MHKHNAQFALQNEADETIYNRVEEEAQEVKLANPIKTRLIAEARIKNDKLDAKTLAHLLRIDSLFTSYVPDKETRQRREILRHRAFLIRIRSRVKSWIRRT